MIISLFLIFHNQRSRSVKNTTTTVDPTDEAIAAIESVEEEGNAGCQVRRKIEDYLERRRYQDELGELEPI